MFEHVNVKLPEGAIFKISPSGIEGFFSNPVLWYKEHVLKEGGFEGNTGSTIGDIVHYCAEQKIAGKGISNEVIENAVNDIDNKAVDKAEVLSSWEAQKDVLFSEYLDEAEILDSEKSMFAHIKGGVYVAGTCDAREEGVVVDFKNVAKKPSDSIPFKYFIQAMAYAYMYKKLGVHIHTIRIVYTVRPTKTLPARVFKISKKITQEDWTMIENTLELIADTIITSRDKPELTYLLFKSMQFKTRPKPVRFV